MSKRSARLGKAVLSSNFLGARFGSDLRLPKSVLSADRTKHQARVSTFAVNLGSVTRTARIQEIHRKRKYSTKKAMRLTCEPHSRSMKSPRKYARKSPAIINPTYQNKSFTTRSHELQRPGNW